MGEGWLHIMPRVDDREAFLSLTEVCVNYAVEEVAWLAWSEVFSRFCHQTLVEISRVQMV